MVFMNFGVTAFKYYKSVLWELGQNCSKYDFSLHLDKNKAFFDASLKLQIKFNFC